MNHYPVDRPMGQDAEFLFECPCGHHWAEEYQMGPADEYPEEECGECEELVRGTLL